MGLPGEALDGRHQPCPKCGGTDRWRVFEDFDEKGGAICNQCLPNAGDGFEVAAWWTGKKFAEVVNEVGEFLGMKPEEKKTKEKKTTKAKKDKKDDAPKELEVELKPWRQGLIPFFLKNNPGITERGLRLAGTEFGKCYGANALLFKAFGEDLKTISGYVAMSVMDKCIVGNKRKLCVRNTKNGLIGEDSIRLLSAGGIVETVWKVEGPTDLAALISIIPEEEWGKHVVITASNGADAIPAGAPEFLASHAEGVCVIADRDDAGERGAEKWANAIIDRGGRVRMVELPADSGKDVRDFIVTHGPLAWGKLQEIAESSRVCTSKKHLKIKVPSIACSESVRLPGKYQDTLDLLGLDVLCEDEAGIYLYSIKTKKTDKISSDTAKLSHQNLIRIVGMDADSNIGDDDAQVSLKQVRNSIALAASGRRVNDAHAAMRGIGCYKSKDEDGDCIVLCNGSFLSVLNAHGVWRKVERPRYGNMIFKFDSTNWYDHDRIGLLIDRARTDKSWVAFQWDNLESFIDRWTWKRQEIDPVILTSVVGATYIQDLWYWRPQVSITGQSTAGKSSLCKFIFGDKEKPEDFGVFGKLTLKGSMSSAAGIRQAVSGKSMAVCLDEFDSLGQREKMDVIKMLRTAGPGDKIFKGTAGHKAVEFGLRIICWVAGIVVGLDQEMDANRFLTFEMQKPTKEKRDRWRVPTPEECESLFNAFLAISVAYGVEASQAAMTMHQKIETTVHTRMIQGLACGACLRSISCGDTVEGATQYLQHLVNAVAPQEEENGLQSQHLEMLETIMDTTIPTGYQMQLSVAEIVSETADYVDGNAEQYRQLRTQLGIGINKVHGVKCLTVNPKLVSKKINESPKEIAQQLSRIPGAVNAVVKSTNGITRRSVCIPWEFIVDRFYSATEAPEEQQKF
jgi:hypothetical protein